MIRQKLSRRLVLLIPCVMLFAMELSAQSHTVSGTVVAEGEPLPGATILEQGTTNGTITNIDGKFNLKTSSPNSQLKISFIGYKEQTITLNGRTSIDVKMELDAKALEEVVVIGYGTQKKKEVTGAVATVKSEELNKIATPDLGAALQGQIAGVNVQMSSGEPGAASNIQIRGVTSVFGSNEPLYVVDGIPQESNPNLSNNEIESISVMKDAGAASIYGTRAAGGVILITTKQAKEGEMKVTADGYYGIQSITSGMELVNTEEWTYSYFKRAQHFDGVEGTQGYTPLQENQRNVTNSTNVLDQIQVDNAVIQNYSVRMSGGKSNLTHSMVLNYFNQEGVIINSGYERFNVRSNSRFKKGKLTVTSGIGLTLDERDRNTSLYVGYRYNPYQSPFDPNASEITVPGGGGDLNNSRQLIQQTQTINNRKSGALSGNIKVDYKITKDLSVFVRGGGKLTNGLSKFLKPNLFIYDEDGELVPPSPFQRSEVRYTDDVRTSWVGESVLNYRKKIGQHKLNFLIGTTAEKYSFATFYGERLDIADNSIQVLNGGSAEFMGSGSGGNNWRNRDYAYTLIGTLARAQYDYKSKYLFSASVRRDGSSQFSSANKWGIFPSFSAGWNVSSESFWDPIADVVSNFKLRGSYGTTGNQSIPYYSNTASITPAIDYPFGREEDSRLGAGGIQTEFANPDVKWETSKQTNLGLDMAMFANKVTFTADFYHTSKTDMLFPLLLPASTGAVDGGSVALNIGDMVNRGMEYALGYRHKGDFTWSVNYTFTMNRNEVTRTVGPDRIPLSDSQGILQVQGNEDRVTYVARGYEAGAFFLMETRGVIKTDEDLEIAQAYLPEAQKGDLFYVDQNGDGKLDEADRVYKGSGMPDFEMGFNVNCNYKGFDLAMQWYGSFGNEVYNGSKAFAYTTGNHKDLLYSWSEANPDSDIPVVKTGNTGQLNARAWADVWLEDGSFVRLRNITFGYSLPSRLVKRTGLTKTRFYLAADNPITITKYSGFDPEVGSNGLSRRGLDQGRYPIAAQYRAGVQIGF
ncbi:SusC/RagA family TonB-linked outer membrane protein [Reichenbachiella versicolor]|uniref:SusC/RagA family TonB-linked outer membrane protein n=1 Tax=Reichenbachiella versicolor TaxID=1821036 RepID=UPI001FE5C3BE|nr:TonB-dependent receptor [Reichenbachiella versicolor]